MNVAAPEIGLNATLGDSARVADYARLADCASLLGQAQLIDSATLGGYATMKDRTRASGRARIAGQAVMSDGANAYECCTVDGLAQISEYATVGGTAYIGGWARLHGTAQVRAGSVLSTADLAEPRHILYLGPIGSENRTVAAYRAYSPSSKKWGCLVTAGCFTGTIDKLRTRVQGDPSAWDDDEMMAKLYRADYLAFLLLAETRLREWRKQSKPSDVDIAYWKKTLKAAEARGDYAASKSYLDDRGAW